MVWGLSKREQFFRGPVFFFDLHLCDPCRDAVGKGSMGRAMKKEKKEEMMEEMREKKRKQERKKRTKVAKF